MKDKHGLLTGPIDQVLKNMTIPMVFGLVAILAFSLVDTFFISLLGTDALAAVSFTFPITFAVNCITMGIGVGLSTCIARSLGKRDIGDAARVSGHGLILAVLLVIVASIIGLSTIDPLFRLLGAQDRLLPLIHDYMNVWYLSIPLLVIPMAGNSAIRATGDTKTPAKIMIVAGVINGLLDPLLIFGLGPVPELGVQGAAIASAISWAGALVCSLYVLIKREKLLARPSPSKLIQDWKDILAIGTPAALSNALNPISGAILMMLLAAQGTAAVAAYGAAQRIESLLLIVMMALTSTLTPLMAQNFGASNPSRAFDALFRAMRFSILFQLLIFIAMVPLSAPIASMFSQEPAVQNKLWHYLIVVPASYGMQGVMMMLVSALNAMKKPVLAFAINLMRLFVLLLPMAWIGSLLDNTEGMFIGIAAANGIAGMIAYGIALLLRRRTLATPVPTS
ncbi:MATE family efflux transporter [Enterovibrio norvegicus FF-162]|uniref:Multidrug resistance protein NorM n=1 Tax=Enterovibrio norvegicus FF-454 TaxID=1185651 RepID=A0A1E5CF52_9GAMM|nr:MATE family efflux transporter [Enterovibrio norvegicus]OEE64085.1 MATE family efflux transporter [Enterovibrio norvegicus FF-454]OEE80744.1 MATE family efflux transporter [Enterovibrio norvegicus FF-162]